MPRDMVFVVHCLQTNIIVSWVDKGSLSFLGNQSSVDHVLHG
jgi:hypothetical protein